MSMTQTQKKISAIDTAFDLLNLLREIDDVDFVDTVVAAIANNDEDELYNIGEILILN